MQLRQAFLPGFVAVALAAACGGSTFNKTGDGGEAGSVATGGASSVAGKPSRAGSSNAGDMSGGGSSAVAGTAAAAGAPNCAAVDCAYPACTDGAVPYTPAGSCCPICSPPRTTSCDGVMCQDATSCPQGYKTDLPPGACCAGCVPDGTAGCLLISCPKSLCPAGYVRGDQLGGCCTDCLPDPKYCNADADCVIADRPRSCCGCPEAISTRMYAADDCWSMPSAPRMVPQDCYPQAVCDAVCGACAPPGIARCENHHCLEMGLK